jgi:signal-transduction protein with cAMP-binding, CBS, and nucleotidyltransferase domain
MDEIMKSLETLRDHAKFFSDFPKRTLTKFAEHCRFVAFKAKQQITKRNEPVDFFAIILKGVATITVQN